MNDALLTVVSSGALVGVLGTFLRSWLNGRLTAEADERSKLIKETETLSVELRSALDRIYRLELEVLKKVHEINVLNIKYDELEKQYAELLERYHDSQDTVKRLLERLVMGEERRRNTTPPSFPLPQPHMTKK